MAALHSGVSEIMMVTAQHSAKHTVLCSMQAEHPGAGPAQTARANRGLEASGGQNRVPVTKTADVGDAHTVSQAQLLPTLRERDHCSSHFTVGSSRHREDAMSYSASGQQSSA